MIRTALAASFALRGCTSTIRLLYTLPNRAIVTVVSMLQISFCAVPAFIRVDPVSTSGPTSGVMAMPASCASSDPGTQVIATVAAPRRPASPRERARRRLNRLGDPRNLRSHGIRHRAVFGVDYLQHLFCGQEIEVHRPGIAHLCDRQRHLVVHDSIASITAS